MEYLPEAIIHRIQSFLTGKDAARTTLLSKSWRIAWLTRPHLDFDEQNHSEPEELFDVVSKCIRRYVQSNLKIQSFILSMLSCSTKASAHAAHRFIVKALEIGATRLAIRMKDLDRHFVLPNEVFASEKLVDLSVAMCEIRDNCTRSVIRCSRLKSLTLDQVLVKCNVIAHIVSHCPLIEKLSLPDMYETKFSFYHKVYTEKTVGDCPIGLLPKMHNLRSLVLTFLRFKSLFKGDLSSSKFPALKDLTLHCSQGFREGDNPIQISNHSLEQLNFIPDGRIVRAEFDVPSICRFTYKGNVETSLSFKSTAREWESNVSINGYIEKMSWFYALNKFLTGLSTSTKIYLSLHVSCSSSFDYDVEDIQGLPKPQLENLTIDNMTSVPSLSCYALFDGLFRICSPKFITQFLVPESSDGYWKTNNHFLCGAFVRKMTGKRTARSFYMDGLDDLKEVSLCIWDEVDGEWNEVVPLESLLDVPSPTKKQKIQFRLG